MQKLLETKKVVRNARSRQKVDEQLVEGPSRARIAALKIDVDCDSGWMVTCAQNRQYVTEIMACYIFYSRIVHLF